MFWPFGAAANNDNKPKNTQSREVLEDSFMHVERGDQDFFPAAQQPNEALPPLKVTTTASSSTLPPQDLIAPRHSVDTAPGTTPVEPFPPSLSGFFLEMLGVSSPTMSETSNGLPMSPKHDLSDAFNEFEGLDAGHQQAQPIPQQTPLHPRQPMQTQPQQQSPQHPISPPYVPPKLPVQIPASVTRVASYPAVLSQSAPDAPGGLSSLQSPPTTSIFSTSLNSSVRSSLDTLIKKSGAAVEAVATAVKTTADEVNTIFSPLSSSESLDRPSPFDEIRRPVVLSGRYDDTEGVVDIRPHLPALLREASKWSLTYSMEQHGISLNTLYQRCAAQQGDAALLAIRNAQGDVFGAFGSEAFRVQSGYYGTGTCFLWKVDSATDEMKAYHATGKNDYLMLSEPHYIALGGGEGHFGLWIDDQLYNGHSGPCQTFENERLSSTSEFQVVGLEVWSFHV
ncbi:hypothetical protein PhCBS80983_g00792 [Powellomyces hirtus]|uniref:Oxidation resistance protein 1 n=1 Tax=Powellomyces hirtus TaxID=109895 RepID=A0A507EF51_9FUNG|nr:hypothetical protein PhCBS80983_g00792 [Powellomyces hirtus]